MEKKKHILICGGTGCRSSKSNEIAENMNTILKEKGMEDDVEVVLTGCFGFCEKGPIIKVMPENTFYVEVQPEDAGRIIEQDLIKNERIEDLLYIDPKSGEKVYEGDNVEFYKKQMRVALRNCGLIDPESIDEYFGNKGYQALGKVLTEMKPEDVIEEVKTSGIQGRGGGGFPSGIKWEFAAKQDAPQKYIICNADEGDPGAFMDRSILEGDPHSVIEAMSICGYATKATEGFVYIRAEYPLAVQRLKTAITQAKEAGLLGSNILGSDFSFDIEIRLGAGAFVCGEEMALIASIEGERGMPRNKPPFPAEKGLWGMPTIINNVETLANIPQIITNGAQWFKDIGTPEAPGTKVFALGGKINNTGLVEVPIGTKLSDVIYDIGGGIPKGKKFKAVQTGGPSGGCIPTEHLDIPIGYKNLIKLGSMMGSGGMIVMDEDNCMVDIAKFFLEFTVDESCGKCTPCREGTKLMLKILEDICDGNGRDGDIEKLEGLARSIKSTSLCGLGQTAPNPVISTLKYFRNEYEEHIYNKNCPSKACKGLLSYEITSKCIGCTKCARACPVDAIKGSVKEVHTLDSNTCIKCSACIDACPVGAVVK